jgi:hypothetical protein
MSHTIKGTDLKFCWPDREPVKTNDGIVAVTPGAIYGKIGWVRVHPA